jgi:nucleoside-diphosphate-sugar epimerase
MDNELHVIFGAGQVGYPLAQTLLAAGKRVRLVKRKAGDVPPGAELLLGDATREKFCHEACVGASVVYHCMNPMYDAKIWAVMLPRYMDNLMAAASAVGARLVVLDNLYMLGRTAGRAMNEATPANPCSKKGEIRARVAEHLFDAVRQGEVRAVCGRASDFYGPRGALTMFGEYFWKPVLTGKPGLSPVNPDTRHTYHYIPDVAQGLATLGCATDETLSGQALWMLPCQPAVTSRDMIARFEAEMGGAIPLNVLPRWLLNGMGWVVPMLGEIKEMAYQWDQPFIVDDSRFRARFGAQVTGETDAVRATLAWARSAYGKA